MEGCSTLPDVAFYNHRTSGPSSALDEIASKPVQFAVAVKTSGLQQWEPIGQRPLQGDVAKPVVMFSQDSDNFRKCTIFDTAGMRKEVGPEACVGLERSAVWDPHHVEVRLLDTFMGRPNAVEQAMRVRLK